jgi:predicted ATPase
VLQHVIAHRITSLSSDVEALLGCAAVAGQEWHLAVIEVVLGWPEDRLLQALEAALHAKVIVAESEQEEIYRFSHGLMREVLYRQQLTRSRKHLHEHVAGALEELAARHRIAPDPASLAHHFMAAEDWEQAIHYSVREGEAARDRHTSHNALLFFQQELEAAGRLPTA